MNVVVVVTDCYEFTYLLLVENLQFKLVERFVVVVAQAVESGLKVFLFYLLLLVTAAL